MRINQISFDTSNTSFQSKKEQVGIVKSNQDVLRQNDLFISQKINTELGIEDRHNVLNNLVGSLSKPIFTQCWAHKVIPCILSPQVENSVAALSKYYTPEEELAVLKKIAANKSMRKDFDRQCIFYLLANNYLAVTAAEYKKRLLSSNTSPATIERLIIYPANFGLNIIDFRIKELKKQLAPQHSFLKDIFAALGLKIKQ